MKSVKAVIGGNYGEEGKGLMTRYFCINHKKPITIFYQGSSNRGATIDLIGESGKPAQVSNLGAGILDNNTPTYFSKYFMIQPTDLRFEIYNLLTKYISNEKLVIFADKDCPIVTPIDQKLDEIRFRYINQQGIEFSSCCVGSNSCTNRFKLSDLRYTLEDFFTKDPIELCNKIYDEWFLRCLTIFGVEKMPNEFNKFSTRDKGIIDGFYEKISIFKDTIETLKKNIQIKSFDEIYNQFDTLIFESSIGIKMSNSKPGINTTSSDVGVKNCVELLKDYLDYKAEACYVTRSYCVRHGAGPFPEYNENLNFQDAMNEPSEFQGYMRFGDLNYDEFIDRCRNDFKQCPHNWVMTTAMTHINELDNKDKNKFNYLSYSKYAEEVIINDNSL